MKVENKTRVLALEGVRGIAAIIVVIFHVLISFFPAVYYSPTMGTFAVSGFERFVYSTPLYAPINGRFAVAVFFILSGFVLSVGYFSASSKKDANRKNVNQALKRYWRLMIPALGSVLLAWMIVSLGLNFNQQSYAITGSLRLHSSWNFDPSFLGALYQGFIGVFYGQDWYNQPLWTMQWEFLGSCLIFVFLWLFGRNRFRYVLYAIAFIGLAHSYLLGFVIGMLMADLYVQKKLPKIRLAVAIVLIVCGMFFAAINSYSSTGISGLMLGIYDWAFWWYFIGATLVVYAVLQNDWLNGFMEKKQLVSVGMNTFSLYLVHDVLLLSLMAFLFSKLQPAIGYGQAFVVAAVSFGVVLVPVTIVFTKYVDLPAISFSRNFAKKVLLRK